MARRRLSKVQRSLAFLIASVVVLGLTAGIVLRSPSTKDWHQEGRELVGAGRYEAALRSYDEALSRLEQDVPAEDRTRIRIQLLAERGFCNLELGRERHALQDYREARGLDPDDPDLWLKEGAAHLDGDRFLEAADLFEEAAQRFDDRRDQFAFAAGCARYQQSRTDVDAALSRIVAQTKSEEARALQREIEDSIYKRGSSFRLVDYVEPGSNAEQDLIRLLSSARSEYRKADELLTDYSRSHLMEPGSGLLVIDMLRRSGRLGHAQLLAEMLLQLEPEHPKAPGLRTQLANLHFNMQNYEEAGKLFAANRGPLRRSGSGSEARRAEEFAIECFLRADRPQRALTLLNPTTILDSAQVMPLFHLGVALWKSGDPDAAIRPLEKVAEILRLRHFSGGWARDDEHRAWILANLAQCLLQAQRTELARPVVEQAQLLFPNDIRWSRALVTLQDDSRKQGASPRRWLDVLRSGPRDDQAFGRWITASIAEYQTVDSMERQVSSRTRSILDRQSRQRRESGKGRSSSNAVLDFIQSQGYSRKERDRLAAEAALKARGSALLGSLENEPFLALQVYYALRDQGHRDQSYLVLLALSDIEPEVEQFRALLAAHDYADGRYDLAGETWSELVHVDLQDWRSLFHAWSSLHRADERRAAAELEKWALDEAPEAVGRMLLTASCLRQGFLDQAIAIAETADVNEPAGSFSRGLGALALLRTGRADEASKWSQFVLQKDPDNIAAAAARLLSVNAGRGSRNTSASQLLQTAEARWSRLAPEDLLFMAQALIAGRDFDSATRVLYWCLEQDASHIPARQQLVDCLVALGSTSEAGDHLQRLERDLGIVVDLPRQTLLRLRAGDLDDCYAELRAWSARGLEGKKSMVWLALVGAATGHLSTALEVLPQGWELTEEQARFLALQISRHDQSVVSQLRGIPPQIAARLRSLATPEEQGLNRDRELEVALSHELSSSENGELSQALLPLILLRDEDEFAILREVWEAEVQQRFPLLSSLSMRVARRHHATQRLGAAVQVLVDHLEADPTDTEALILLQSWSNDLSPGQLTRVLDAMERLQAPDGMRALIEGLAAAREGDPAAFELLRRASSSVEPIGLALAPILRLRQQESLVARSTPFSMSPYEAVQDAMRRRRSIQQFEDELEQTLEQYPDDPALRATLVRYVDSSDDPLEVTQSLKLRLGRILLEVPAPPWSAYETATAIALDQSRAPDALLKLANSIRLAMQRHPREVAGSVELVQALVNLSHGLREFDLADTARGLLAEAIALQPYDPDLLAERARFEAGRTEQAAEYRARAYLCGHRDAADLAWLARDALERKQALDEALLWSDRAIEAFDAETSALLEAPIRRLRAQLATLQGDRKRALQEFQLAARVLGSDPDEDLDRAFALFADGRKAAARRALSTVIDQKGAPRQLIERMLEALGDGDES